MFISSLAEMTEKEVLARKIFPKPLTEEVILLPREALTSLQSILLWECLEVLGASKEMLLPLSLHALGYFLCGSTWGNVSSVQAPATELPYYSSAFNQYHFDIYK